MPDESKSSFIRILMVVIPLGAAIIIGTLYGPTILKSFSTQKFVAVSGKVEFNGEPVTEGFVQIYEIGILGKNKKPRWPSSLGTFNKDGTFNIKTDLNDGALPGEYVVVVKSMKGSPPVNLVPDEYVEINTTPLRIKVDSDPAKNSFSFTLEGEVRSAPGGGGGEGPGNPFQKGKGEEKKAKKTFKKNEQADDKETKNKETEGKSKSTKEDEKSSKSSNEK